MATIGYRSPFMGSVTANATAAQSIYTLLSAIWTNLPIRACYIKIQLNSTAGAASLYIGNENVAANMCGYAIVASQSSGEEFYGDSNLFDLQRIYLLASAGEVQVNLVVGVR